jgi:hypothetical protein
LLDMTRPLDLVRRTTRPIWAAALIGVAWANRRELRRRYGLAHEAITARRTPPTPTPPPDVIIEVSAHKVTP